MKKNKKLTRAMKEEEKMTRKEAIKKAGITALTASSLVFLATKKAVACSDNDDDNNDDNQFRPSRPGKDRD